ncbi:hypothetical protein EDB80DRAFT_401259 [Ilyonectria destructans]|nr:hypothetical protein EDB80DRAFT_401259 [Ilyonectria destructans]
MVGSQGMTWRGLMRVNLLPDYQRARPRDETSVLNMKRISMHPFLSFGGEVHSLFPFPVPAIWVNHSSCVVGTLASLLLTFPPHRATYAMIATVAWYLLWWIWTWTRTRTCA